MIEILLFVMLGLLLTQQYYSPRFVREPSDAEKAESSRRWEQERQEQRAKEEAKLKVRQTTKVLHINLYAMKLEQLKHLAEVYREQPEQEAIDGFIQKATMEQEQRKRDELIYTLSSQYRQEQEDRIKQIRQLPTSELEQMVAKLEK